LLEAETQDLLWHYKSQRKASVRGRGGIGLKSGRKKKRGRREQRNEQNTNVGRTGRRALETQKKGGLYREGEKGRGATQRRVLALPLPSSLQKKKDP
jgi:hypothetical protein